MAKHAQKRKFVTRLPQTGYIVLSVLLVLLAVTALLWACGVFSIGKKPVKPDAKKLYSAYFSSKFKTDSASKYFFDFNRDGNTEMLVVQQKFKDGKVSTDRVRLYYYTVKNNKVKLTHGSSIKGSLLKDDETAANGYGFEYIEAGVNKYGFISLNIVVARNTVTADYYVFGIKDNKIKLRKHLIDPGREQGVALYLDENKKNVSDNTLAFADDGSGNTSGKFASYAEAIEQRIGKYGFVFNEFQMPKADSPAKFKLEKSKETDVFFEYDNTVKIMAHSQSPVLTDA